MLKFLIYYIGIFIPKNDLKFIIKQITPLVIKKPHQNSQLKKLHIHFSTTESRFLKTSPPSTIGSLTLHATIPSIPIVPRALVAFPNRSYLCIYIPMRLMDSAVSLSRSLSLFRTAPPARARAKVDGTTFSRARVPRPQRDRFRFSENLGRPSLRLFGACVGIRACVCVCSRFFSSSSDENQRRVKRDFLALTDDECMQVLCRDPVVVVVVYCCDVYMSVERYYR